MWQNVDRNDIALAYHDGEFVARAQVLQLRHDPDLVEYLWRGNVDHGRWDDESLGVMTFLADIVEIDVNIEKFNKFVGYNEIFRPRLAGPPNPSPHHPTTPTVAPGDRPSTPHPNLN